MTRELKILKGVLLLRGYGNPYWDGNRYQSKEEQIDELKSGNMSDKDLDEWIESLLADCKKTKEEVEREHEESIRQLEEGESTYTEEYEDDYYYSPSCPWNAPGMSVRDFIYTI